MQKNDFLFPFRISDLLTYLNRSNIIIVLIVVPNLSILKFIHRRGFHGHGVIIIIIIIETPSIFQKLFKEKIFFYPQISSFYSFHYSFKSEWVTMIAVYFILFIRFIIYNLLFYLLTPFNFSI